MKNKNMKKHKCKFELSRIVQESDGIYGTHLYIEEYAYIICKECGRVRKVKVEYEKMK